MHFGDERAGGVNHAQLPFLCFGAHARWDAVGAENENRADGNFLDGFDKNGAATAQLVHDVAVMHDLVMDVYRIAVGFEREFDDIDRADYSRAEAAGANTYERLGSVVGAVNLGQSQIVLR